jgi:hypothetical protein
MLDRTAFFADSFADAERRATGDTMTLSERLEWNARTVRAAYGYDPDVPVPLDRTAFRAWKIGE